MTANSTNSDCRQFSGLCSSALSASGNWSIGDPDENSDLEVDTFDLVYHGGLNIDRRYAPSVFQWLAKKLLRLNKVSEKVTAHISRTNLQITERHDHSVVTQDHSFDSIYRLSRLRHCELDNYFAYIIHEKADTPVCVFHVFECDNLVVKADFLKSLKTRVLGFQKLPTVCPEHVQTPYNITPPLASHKRGSLPLPVAAPNNLDPVFRDSVYYIGKVTISQPQAPPKFIDDVLPQLTKIQSSHPKRSSSGTNLVGEVQQHQAHLKKVSSCDFGKLIGSTYNEDCCENGLNDREVEIRQRSVTMLRDTESETEPAKVTKDGISDDLNNIQEEVHSRLVTLQVSKMFLMLFSVGTKTMLLEKKINNISFCTKGDLRSDHFGFICREAGSHICYIFQGESEQKVEAIMKAMKQAFNEALDASAHLTLCESCPLQIIHKICVKLESAATVDEKDNIIQEYSKCLSEYEQLHIEEKVNEKSPSDDMERIEININVLREVFDRKQLQHKHSHKISPSIIPDVNAVREQRPRSQTIFEKAKKSLSNSFQSFTQKKANGGKPASPRSNENFTRLRTRSYESSDNFPSLPNTAEFDVTDGGTDPKEKRCSRGASIIEVEGHVPEKVVEENEDTFDEEMKPLPVGKLTHLQQQPRKGSWRQAIYDSVISDSRKSSTGSLPTEYEVEEKNHLDPGQRARMRWKQAINNQILLIRMDKENKKLAANIKGTEERREKMSYEELGIHNSDSDSIWQDILSRNDNEKLDNHILFDALRSGVSKARRGEIWRLLIRQFMIRSPETSTDDDWRKNSLQSLLKEDTNHQHAILIDLGRTFPTYDYFVTRLGPGQLSLFNLLKAYSLLDKEVGYCQGLSFVAGLLLMHMPEEEAFKSFCHLMFDLKIRRQYKPDMSVVQQQLYQLSRLLHDYHPKLTEHLKLHDVTPTLYAAPWFLTLYASQYPIGFVARIMDLLLLQGLEVIFKVALVLVGNHAEEILRCDSFESIVEYMKVTIPEKVVNETDDICTRAIDMDIKQQLNLYEVEYQLLHEEMIDIRQSRERIEKQELAQKELEDKVTTLEAELAKANETIANLRAELVDANRQRDCFSLSSSCDREVLTLGLEDCASRTIDEEKLRSNSEEEQVSSLSVSSNSSNNDVAVTADQSHFINGILTPSLNSLRIGSDEMNEVNTPNSDCVNKETVTVSEEEKLSSL